MTTTPRTGIDFRDLYRKLLADERDALIQLGLDFLSERLSHIESRIERLNAKLQQHYPNPDTLPAVEVGRLENYQTNRELLESLRQASHDTPFIEVHQRRLVAARQHVIRLLRQKRDRLDSATQAARYQAWLEQEFLVDLRVKWLIWLRPSRWNDIGRHER